MTAPLSADQQEALAQMVPPAYTETIGRQLAAALAPVS